MYRLNKNIQLITTEYETILVKENEKVMTLNETGKDVLELLISDSGRSEMIKNLCEKYKGSEEIIVKNIDDYINNLLELEIVEKSESV